MTRRTWLACFLLIPALNTFAAAADEPPGLDLYFVDVDGGAATLIVTPERESVLIDTGWPGRDDRDPKRIAHALKHAGLDHLDHLVISHWHMDHHGGVEGLSKLVRIDHFWDRGLPDLTKPDQDKVNFPDGPRADDPLGVAYLKASDGKRKTLSAGDDFPLRGTIKARVLAASGKTIADDLTKGDANPICADLPPDQPVDNSDNARSIVLLFRLGQFEFLDCGDLTWNVERRLVCPTNVVGQVDVFKVTHHGLDISNHPTFLKSIAPTVSVMVNGPNKGGSADTVKRLRELPTLKAAYQLHKNAKTGADENTDPAHIVNQDKVGGKFLHVHVAPDGSRYTVRQGEDGRTESFESK
jgi:beta-lactamase superfamily II metal-dependent hydrolase